MQKKSNCLYYDWKSTKFTKQMPLGWVVTRKVGKVLLAFGKVGDFFFGKVANASLCIVDCKRNIQHVIDGIVLFAYLLTCFKKKNTSFVQQSLTTAAQCSKIQRNCNLLHLQKNDVIF